MAAVTCTGCRLKITRVAGLFTWLGRRLGVRNHWPERVRDRVPREMRYSDIFVFSLRMSVSDELGTQTKIRVLDGDVWVVGCAVHFYLLASNSSKATGRSVRARADDGPLRRRSNAKTNCAKRFQAMVCRSFTPPVCCAVAGPPVNRASTICLSPLCIQRHPLATITRCLCSARSLMRQSVSSGRVHCLC